MISVKVKIDRRDNKDVFATLLDADMVVRKYREHYNTMMQHATSTFWLDFKDEETMFRILAECNVACSGHGIVILKKKEIK